MPPLGRPPVMLDIVEEHFEELDFLWERREGVIFAPDWNLEELAELEERAEAHLDGLRIAEQHAVDIARPQLTGDRTFAATAATFVFMETGEAEHADEVVQAFASAEPPARNGIRIALRHSRIDAIEKSLRELAGSAAPAIRAAAADVLAFQRRALPDIRALLADEDDGVRILVFGALGRGVTPLDPAALASGLRAKVPAVRRGVLEAAARSGAPGLEGICWQAASRRTDPDPEAMSFLGVLGDVRSLALFRDALSQPDLAPAAILGLGALGRVEAIPVLLDSMEKKETGTAAAAAFRRITGARAEDIAGKRPEPPPAGAADLEAEFADETAPPDAAKARAWWGMRERSFDPSQRWQAGRDVSARALVAVFDALPLATRRDLYLGARASGDATLPQFELEQRVAFRRRG